MPVSALGSEDSTRGYNSAVLRTQECRALAVWSAEHGTSCSPGWSLRNPGVRGTGPPPLALTTPTTMTRRILWQTSAPAVLLGLTLLGVCLAGAWSVGRLQANLALILSDDVACVEAALELEIQLRHLRVHSLLCVLDPSPRRRTQVERDHAAFEAA